MLLLGDMVQLTSGGPPMTIVASEGEEENKAACPSFNDDWALASLFGQECARPALDHSQSILERFGFSDCANQGVISAS